MSGLDFKGLAEALLARSRELIPAWLPGGKFNGREYYCGSTRGGPGDSCRVNVKSGKWADFASDDKGGDLISLYASIHGITQGDAAKQLADQLNFSIKPNEVVAYSEPPSTIGAPPPGTPMPAMIHVSYGEPSASWIYKDKNGSMLFAIARYETDSGKQLAPWSWDTTSNKWVSKGWPEPRPLYNLDKIHSRPNAPILIVEGEKAADAAEALLGSTYVVTTWPNGSNAAAKADWTPIHGRNKVLLWPDADRKVADTETKAEKYGVRVGEIIPYEFQPGPAVMFKIAAALEKHVGEIKIINVGIDKNRADGWDAADALRAGWNRENVVLWAKPQSTVFHVQQTSVQAAEDEPASESNTLLWTKLGLATTKQGVVINVDNAVRVFENYEPLKGIVWQDEFHQRLFTKWNSRKIREWSDVDNINLMLLMQRELGLRRMSDDMVFKAVQAYGHRHPRHEVRDWMNTLPWDNESRIEEFFIKAFGCKDTPYIRSASHNFWVGMVARIFRPGCQLDTMVVLEGAQGIGKTQALRMIGGPWYSESAESVMSKDFFMGLHGKMLVEISEMNSFNRAEVTRIKQVMTTLTDRFRAPYARTTQDYPRQSIFVGTTNEESYLRDSTGGRRFWPITCTKIDLGYIRENREQLFAEAVVNFKAGDTWYVMPLEETQQEQEARRHEDEWVGIIQDFLRGKTETAISDIGQHLELKRGQLDMGSQKRIGGILRHLKWTSFTQRIDGSKKRLWKKTEADPLIPDSMDLEFTPDVFEDTLFRE